MLETKGNVLPLIHLYSNGGHSKQKPNYTNWYDEIENNSKYFIISGQYQTKMATVSTHSPYVPQNTTTKLMSFRAIVILNSSLLHRQLYLQVSQNIWTIINKNSHFAPQKLLLMQCHSKLLSFPFTWPPIPESRAWRARKMASKGIHIMCFIIFG